MNIEEYMCPICREILLEPVTLPCKHTCCYDCLEKTLDSNKYQCFMCRKFIGSWYRNAKRKNFLINDKLWKLVQNEYGDLVEKRNNGESVEITCTKFPTSLSAPGEIKREFELCEEKIRKENQILKEKEEKLNEELIKRLQAEEEEYCRKQAELAIRDEELARNLAEELNSHENVRVNNEQIQLSEDEKIARTLQELERNSPSSHKHKGSPSNPFSKNKERTHGRVSFGPMDLFLEKRKRRNF